MQLDLVRMGQVPANIDKTLGCKLALFKMDEGVPENSSATEPHRAEWGQTQMVVDCCYCFHRGRSFSGHRESSTERLR